MKNKKIIRTIEAICIFAFFFFSCGLGGNGDSTKSHTPDLSSKEGVKNHLINNSWAQWDGKLTFKNDGTCNFFMTNLRTNQVEWNINGRFNVDKSKFEDNGDEYWYVKIEWAQTGVISDFYTIYQSHLVEQDRLYFDSYGPVLKSWKSEGGLVLDRDKVYPISK